MNPADDPSPGAAHDEWVVLRCQMGEREAFDLLIARWHPLLWRYAISLTNDPDAAADVVQDVWLRVLRGLVRLRDAVRFRAWLFGIARRVLMDRLRVRYAEPVFDAIDLAEMPQAVADDDIEGDLSVLQVELARLPMLEREVLTLFYLRELSLTEIAEIAAIPVGTVKSRLFRARHLLRQQLVTKGGRP
ncbi:MAG TPA: RNA polymerase sigma factor [Vicinamibacterales bacterium]|nr:RNA polymerase sigma factor [Vicinamibacterales bacterium]